MRHERLQDVVRLALRLQGTRTGLTLEDIQNEFQVSRSTAERMRNTVEASFGPLELADSDDNRRHWRLRSPALRDLVMIQPEEIAELHSAAESLERSGLDDRASTLRELDAKLRALLPSHSQTRIEPDLEALLEAEGLAMRAGPRPKMPDGVLSVLREAIKACRLVEFEHIARTTGKTSRQKVEPYGLLYGNRAFLVGKNDWSEDMRLWRLSSMDKLRITSTSFERDEAFSLREYAARSFGTFQAEPTKIVIRFDPSVAEDAGSFIFHPNQKLTHLENGSLRVEFFAAGMNEICWHLFTWGDAVAIEKPKELREKLMDLCKSVLKRTEK